MTIQELERAKHDLTSCIDSIVATLDGADRFRVGVEELLVGTPWEKPSFDAEGLYGRVRAAIVAARASLKE